MAGTSALPGPGSADETVPIQRAFAADPAPLAKKGAAPPGDNSRIVFATDRHGPDPVGDHGNPEIYIMNPDGTDQRRLTYENAADETPALSPDGSMIAFASQRNGGTFEIFLMNSDGTNQRRLTDFTKLGIGAVQPAWAPDGKRILFKSRVKRIDLYVINVDGTGLVKLTDEPRGVNTPAWSPDGRKIAFANLRHGPPEMYVMNPDGSGQIRLTFNTWKDVRPSWSPDSRRIAFHSDRDGEMEIYVMNADGSDTRRLTRNPTEDGFPSWSPDGKRIVFHRRVLGHGAIFTMNADGSDVRRLTEISPVAFSGFPNWGRAKR
jgi:TolB protein